MLRFSVGEVQFVANGWYCFVDEGTYQDGAIDETFSRGGDEKFIDSTFVGLLDKLLSFTGGTIDDTNIIREDKDTSYLRVDIYVLENKEGYSAMDHEVEQWKSGEINLYRCNYNFIVEKIRRVPIDLGIDVDVTKLEDWR